MVNLAMEESAEVDEVAAREARFAAFVDAHRARAVSTAWRLVGGDAAAAEDVAQDAFVKAWKALPKFRDDARLSTWFYRILVRTASNHRRWKGVRDKWRAFTGDEVPDVPTETPSRDQGLQRRIAEALDGLSKGQREVFVLVHLEGFTVKEAAEVLGKAQGTLKSHLHRALKSLRRELKDLMEEGGDDVGR